MFCMAVFIYFLLVFRLSTLLSFVCLLYLFSIPFQHNGCLYNLQSSEGFADSEMIWFRIDDVCVSLYTHFCV